MAKIKTIKLYEIRLDTGYGSALLNCRLFKRAKAMRIAKLYTAMTGRKTVLHSWQVAA